jgi:soluble lytic murein transglycosylase-like protein
MQRMQAPPSGAARFLPPPRTPLPERSGPASSASNFAEGAPEGSRPPRAFGAELDAMIRAEAVRQGVNPDLVRAVVRQESGGRPDAVSSAGAIGLMQLMPGTARELGVNPHDPAQNLAGGVRYLKEMAARFGNLDQALAAYNAGPGAVQRFGGVPPYRETQDYVRRIRRTLNDPGS